MAENKKKLLNSVLSQDRETFMVAVKEKAMEMVEATRKVASEELFSCARSLPEADETVQREIVSALKIRDLPEDDDENVFVEDIFGILSSAVEENEEKELFFEGGDVYVITPEVAKELLERVTAEELEEASGDYEAFTELVHGALDEEFEVDVSDIEDGEEDDN